MKGEGHIADIVKEVWGNRGVNYPIGGKWDQGGIVKMWDKRVCD